MRWLMKRISLSIVKHLGLLLVAMPMFSSCLGYVTGLTSGYNHLSKQERANVVKYDGDIDSIRNLSKVYAVTSEQIKHYLSRHKNVIVYDYTPECRSANCINPARLVDMCAGKGADVLVVANMYDDVFTALNPDFPILMINTDVLKSKWRGKYIDEFFQALSGRTLKETNYASYHYFKKGKYVRSFLNPNEIRLVAE